MESEECASLRETLKSIEESIVQNTVQLTECWKDVPLEDASELVKDRAHICTYDKTKSERWYKGILKQLKGGKNVETVFRQLMVVCQSYGLALPPPNGEEERTMRTSLSLFQPSLESFELLEQIYSRFVKHYSEVLKEAASPYLVVRAVTSLSYVISPFNIFKVLYEVRSGQLEAQIPPPTAEFHTRVLALCEVTEGLIRLDLLVLSCGLFRDFTDPHSVLKLLYLDRVESEVKIALKALKASSSLGLHLASLVERVFRLDVFTVGSMSKYCGLLMRDDETAEAEAGSHWDWRALFTPYTACLVEKVKSVQSELLEYLDQPGPDMWLPHTEGDLSSVGETSKRSVGIEHVLSQLLPLVHCFKQLGYVFPSEEEDPSSPPPDEGVNSTMSSTGSGSTVREEEELRRCVEEEELRRCVDEVIAAVLCNSELLIMKVPDKRPVLDLYCCYSSLHTIDNSVLPLSPATKSIIGDLQDQIHAQICYIHQDNLVSVLLLDEGAMNWTKNHTTEISECNPSVQAWNLYLKTLHYNVQQLLPRHLATQILGEVLETSLTYLTKRYLTAKPSYTNTKLYQYDITSILMVCSSFIWLIAEDNEQILEPGTGPLMVIYSHCNRLLGALTVIVSPLSYLSTSLNLLKRTEDNHNNLDSEGLSQSDEHHDSPVLPHSHRTGEQGAPINWTQTTWISNLFNTDTLDAPLLHCLRCLNTLHPTKESLYQLALSNNSQLTSLIALHHQMDKSAFSYEDTVLTISSILSYSRLDTNGWANFMLTTFSPNFIWDTISKPEYKFSAEKQAIDLWQPLLNGALTELVYRTHLLPSTDEEAVIEELPCGCPVNRFVTPNIKDMLHDSLKKIFINISTLAPSLPPTILAFCKLLAVRAQLREGTELPTAKLLIAFFIQKAFFSPNTLCDAGPSGTIVQYVPSDALPILKKVGSSCRQIIMKHVHNVISLSSGVKKFMEHESECVEHALNSLHNQLTLSLDIGSTVDKGQVEYDVKLVERQCPGVFNTFHKILLENQDILPQELNGFISKVQILPIHTLNPLQEYFYLGSFTLTDAIEKEWVWENLSEYLSSQLIRKYVIARWEIHSDTSLTKEEQDYVQVLKKFINKGELF